MNNATKPIVSSQTTSPIHPNTDIKSTDELQTPASLRQRYQFVRQIGKGSQGKIFLAKDLINQTLVAIKQLNISSIKDWKEYELFHREAKVLKTLKFDGVAKFYEAIDCLEDNPPCSYIVQEYIEGTPLQKLLKNGHRFKVTEVCEIILQLLKILEKLHSNKDPIIHRDIKPSNIILTITKSNTYHTTLIDFGAVSNPTVQGGGSTVAGTFGYMPPEQLMGHPSPASDTYALAAVAVYLFGGLPPAELPTKDFRLIFEPQLESFPPNLVATLRQMLEPDENKRLSDIPTLYKIFNEFRLNNYSAIDLPKNQTEHGKYNDRLSQVKYIGQEGNIELWQELSDDTTQKRQIPASYIKMLNQFNVSKIINKSLQHHSHSSLIASLIPLAKLAIIFILFILFAVFINFAIYLYPLVLLPGLILLSWLNHVDKRLKATTNNEKKYDDTLIKRITDDYELGIQSKPFLMDLLKDGRKTIATITKIEYNKIPYYYAEAMGDPNSPSCYMVNFPPSFMITYKFNPPDDLNPNDLIHQVTVPTAPEDHYRVGDPFPILYKKHLPFVSGFLKRELITSMPFPLVLSEHPSLIHSYGSSYNEVFDSGVPFNDLILSDTDKALLLSSSHKPAEREMLSLYLTDIQQLIEDYNDKQDTSIAADLKNLYLKHNRKPTLKIIEWFLLNYKSPQVQSACIYLLEYSIDNTNDARVKFFSCPESVKMFINILHDPHSVSTFIIDSLNRYIFKLIRAFFPAMLQDCAEALLDLCANPETDDDVVLKIYDQRNQIRISLFSKELNKSYISNHQLQESILTRAKLLNLPVEFNSNDRIVRFERKTQSDDNVEPGHLPKPSSPDELNDSGKSQD